MKTIKYFSRIIPFFKSLNMKTKGNTENENNFEFAYPKLGINFKKDSTSKKASKSLLSQMYSVDNETLFI